MMNTSPCRMDAVKIKYTGSSPSGSSLIYGALAQLARAPALQAGGHRFESDMLHHRCTRAISSAG
jgi:hypothetical protein